MALLAFTADPQPPAGDGDGDRDGDGVVKGMGKGLRTGMETGRGGDGDRDNA